MKNEMKVNRSAESMLLAMSFMSGVTSIDRGLRWWPHKKGLMADPNWAVVEYTVDAEPAVCVSVYQGPQPFGDSMPTCRPGRPGYARYKLTTGEEINKLYPILTESYRRFTTRMERAA